MIMQVSICFLLVLTDVPDPHHAEWSWPGKEVLQRAYWYSGKFSCFRFCSRRTANEMNQWKQIWIWGEGNLEIFLWSFFYSFMCRDDVQYKKHISQTVILNILHVLHSSLLTSPFSFLLLAPPSMDAHRVTGPRWSFKQPFCTYQLHQQLVPLFQFGRPATPSLNH